MLNKKEIKEIIPQREPFLMIDEVEEYTPGEKAIAYKNVDINELKLIRNYFLKFAMLKPRGQKTWMSVTDDTR